MTLIYYTPTSNSAGERLRKAINAVVPAKRTEIYRTIGSLSRRLRQPTYNLNIAILLAAGRKELSDLLSLRDLFRDIRIILLLPDRKKETISKGHKLYPRFLSYIDTDFTDVAAVFEKMIGLMNSKY